MKESEFNHLNWSIKIIKIIHIDSITNTIFLLMVLIDRNIVIVNIICSVCVVLVFDICLSSYFGSHSNFCNFLLSPIDGRSIKAWLHDT